MAREEIDRPPVICPGGMMSAATTETLNRVGIRCHTDPVAMAKLAELIHVFSGFENIGVPFCMTAEAEAFGCQVDLGSSEVEPRIKKYLDIKPRDIIDKPLPRPEDSGRLPVILEAIAILKKAYRDIPIIGNIIGPFSLVTSVFDPLLIFRMVYKNSRELLEVLDYITTFLLNFACTQVRKGADIITIADPAATGEILGLKNFEVFVKPFLRKIIQSLTDLRVPVILHICGDARRLIRELVHLQASVLSFDASVNLRMIKATYPEQVIMGNVSTLLLHRGSREGIRKVVKHLLRANVDIISPACGISLRTPVENLRVLTESIKYHRRITTS